MGPPLDRRITTEGSTDSNNDGADGYGQLGRAVMGIELRRRGPSAAQYIVGD